MNITLFLSTNRKSFYFIASLISPLGFISITLAPFSKAFSRNLY